LRPGQTRRIETDTPIGRWHQANLTNLLDDVDVQGLVLTVRDIHERYLADRELRYLATHDVLTTLPDRGGLRTRLEAVLIEAEMRGQLTALIFCDVDNFKTVNDRFGHHIGDLVLTEVALRLSASLRTSDFVGRFGGDEFVVVIPNVDDEAHALALADRVFSRAIGPACVDDVEVNISLSMGVAVSTGLFSSVDELLQHADEAMYRSKREGRGRVSLFSPPSESGKIVSAQSSFAS
jgi:diguanylate cyclase (GGDEF)-like protein